MYYTYDRLRRFTGRGPSRLYYRRKSCAYIDLAEAFVPPDAPRPAGGEGIEPS
jgi:hypothetical protein